MSKKIDLLKSVDKSRLTETRNDTIKTPGPLPAITPEPTPAPSPVQTAIPPPPRQKNGIGSIIALSLAVITLISLNIILVLNLKSNAAQIAGLSEKLEQLRDTVRINAQEAAPIAANVGMLQGTLAQMQKDIEATREQAGAAHKTFQTTFLNISELKEKYQIMSGDIRDLKLMTNIIERYKAPQVQRQPFGEK